MSSYWTQLYILAFTNRLGTIPTKRRNLKLISLYQRRLALRRHLPLLDTARFPSGALLMYHVWLCFPSFSTSWSSWGFVTCSWGSQPSLWGVLLTRGPRWAGQLCRVSVTTVPCGRSTNS